MRKGRLVFFCLFIVSITYNHGFGQKLDPLNVVIEIDGKQLKFPNLGGLISPQFSPIHLDDDGVEDLFIFDRGGDNVLCFINESSGEEPEYRFAPEYAAQFPAALNSWVMIRDYNKDGIGDIFCASTTNPAPGIEVHTGSKNSEGQLEFELMTFDIGDYDILNYFVAGFYTNIYSAYTDIPSIIDVDGDEDLDVLTFDVGGGIMGFYKNYSVEEGYGLDTFIMDVEDYCWGKFFEDDFSQAITLSSSASQCASRLKGDNTLRHSGSTVMAFDQDKNGAMDLVIGDLASPELIFLKNGGNSEGAWMTFQDPTFPNYDVPVEMNIFLASYLMDINNDGLEDLIATPNSKSGGINDHHIWLYTGQESSQHIFGFYQDNFLIDNSLIIGGYSYPALLDFDADGDNDLVIGVNGLVNSEGFFDGRIYLFENVSDVTNIKFVLREDDFLGLNELSESSGRFSPAFGDLDGDGDADAVVGDRAGKLFYFENIAGPGQPVQYSDRVSNYMGIGVGQVAKPQIIDLDEDGLADLVVGERNDNKEGDVLGGLNFFKNIGSVGNPQFNNDPSAGENTSVLGAVFTRDPTFAVGGSSPGFVTLDNDYLAFVGSESGKLRMYKDVKDNLYGNFTLVEENVLPYSLGFNSTVVGDDLNGDGLIDLIIGYSRGGVNFFTTNLFFDGSTPVTEKPEASVVVYPNPSSQTFKIKSSVKLDKIEVYNSNGIKIGVYHDDEIHLIDHGVYILKAYSGENVFTSRIINF